MIIDGKQISQALKDEMKEEVARLKAQYGRCPRLEVIIVGNNPDGILVQLPLPHHIDEQKVIDAISPEKDVDGFHPENVARLWLNQDCILPCTPKGIIVLLEKAGVQLAGKHAVVVGRSNIVGKPVAKLFVNMMREGQLYEYSVHTVVAVESVYLAKQYALLHIL